MIIRGKNDKKLTKNDKTWEKVQVNQQQQQLINFQDRGATCSRSKMDYTWICPMFCKVISHQQTIFQVFSSAKFAIYDLLLNFESKSNSVNCHLNDSCFVTECITERTILIKYSCHYVCKNVLLVTLFKVKVFQQEFDYYAYIRIRYEYDKN